MSEQAYLSITTESQLEEYCQQILANSAISWIAIDTEFVRVDTYFPELSLVQIQDNLGQASIIDPLAIQQHAENDKPLHALIELLASQEVLKVFHSARQDIEVLYHLEGVMPANLFDTQIAAIFKKHGDLAGFARVIENELGVTLDKSQTRTNWHARPLTDEQIQYALDDVRYLAPLYQKYLDELNDNQVSAVMEECKLLLDESIYKVDPLAAGSKIKNLKGLRAKGLAIVNTLAAWREQYAIDNNEPKKWVMSDDVIVSIAKRPPKTVQALYKVPNIKSSSVKAFGELWIELIDEVFALESEALPKPPKKPARQTEQEETTLFYLQSYTQQIARDYHIVPSHLMNKNQLLEIIRNPQTDVLQGWRRALIGKELKMLLNEQGQLTLQNGQVRFIKT